MKFSYLTYISLQFYLCSNFLRYNKNKLVVSKIVFEAY